MAEFFAMDGYGLYIWTSYALTFAFLSGAGLHSWRATRRTTIKKPD